MATTILSLIIIAAFCLRSYLIEKNESKDGFTKEDWKHYRKMMTDSSYRKIHIKKAPIKELN